MSLLRKWKVDVFSSMLQKYAIKHFFEAFYLVGRSVRSFFTVTTLTICTLGNLMTNSKKSFVRAPYSAISDEESFL